MQDCLTRLWSSKLLREKIMHSERTESTTQHRMLYASKTPDFLVNEAKLRLLRRHVTATKLLWCEWQICSVANMARQDAHDFLKIADDLHIRSQATVFSLEQPNEALQAVKQETGHG